MMVYLPGRIAFLAMPKCASTSIENALRPHCQFLATGYPMLTHMHVNRFYRFVMPLLKATGHKEIETCCLMRDPVDWVASWWRYRSDDRWSAEENASHIGFEEYVAEYIAGEKKDYLPAGTQAGFFWAPNRGKRFADYIFRYEDIDLFQDFWSRKIGNEVDFGMHNVSPSREGDLNDEVRQALRNFLAEDYEIWENRTIKRENYTAFCEDHFGAHAAEVAPAQR